MSDLGPDRIWLQCRDSTDEEYVRLDLHADLRAEVEWLRAEVKELKIEVDRLEGVAHNYGWLGHAVRWTDDRQEKGEKR